MPRELTFYVISDTIKWLLLKACLRAKEPFGLEHFLLRKEEKNESRRACGAFYGHVVLGYYRATLCSMVVSGSVLGVLLWRT